MKVVISCVGAVFGEVQTEGRCAIRIDVPCRCVIRFYGCCLEVV